MYNKTIIRFGFCDIQNNHGYQPKPKAKVDNLTPTLTLICLLQKPHPVIVYNCSIFARDVSFHN